LVARKFTHTAKMFKIQINNFINILEQIENE